MTISLPPPSYDPEADEWADNALEEDADRARAMVKLIVVLSMALALGCCAYGSCQ